MNQSYEPSSVQGGKYLLELLRQSRCPNFRSHKDAICTALDVGRYDEHALGATRVEVLELALEHADEAVLMGRQGQYHFINRTVASDIMCALTEARIAQQKQSRTSNIHALKRIPAVEVLAA